MTYVSALGIAALLACATINLSPITASADDGKLALGKEIFLERSEPQCALCHTLADAEAVGEVGPNLDELAPDAERVSTAVINGIGPMPANEALTEEEIEAVALYVSTVAGKAE
ncbi:SorU family sulfite dehydrogenase c-type cytochrome subunit [Sinorhizobium medicae]|uniref:SorU family sulfite dehydrogenase c-type cytochrome subunit n=1 Tax=Sinorhizobium medicae TaxID=110321 RepID=UPI0003FDE2FA|nr:cytochrome c [Sinorhizobium medicae]RVQ78206.1 cytochrome c [Sinorhizobium medicae]